MPRLVVPFKVKQLGEEGDYFTFKGYASTFGNVDLGGDVVVKGAFLDSIQELKDSGDNLSIFWQHDSSEPLGIFPVISEDEKGLFVEGKMPKSDTFVSGRVIPQMKIGSIQKMSIGYSTIEEEMDGQVRLIKKAKLWEASLVSIPMNNSADITEMKTAVPFQDLPLADRTRPWDSGQAIARVREFTDSEDEPGANYKKAFLWYDSNTPALFGAYKLPIADVIDGRLRAVPRAIFAAAAAIRGARGGVDIPAGDRPAVIAHINHYYTKMGLESPFQEQAGFRLDDFGSVEIRDLEKMMTDGFCVSRKMAKTLVGLIESSGLRDAESKAQRDAENWDDALSTVNQTKTMMEDKNA